MTKVFIAITPLDLQAEHSHRGNDFPMRVFENAKKHLE